MRILILNLLLILICITATAQQVITPHGGGSANITAHDDITEAERTEIIKVLTANTNKLKAEGIIEQQRQPQAHPLFIWPLRTANGFTDTGYYGISNYIDHNSAVPNQITDYNCGTRSYDLSSGYNHRGTDIFTWPLPFQKMDSNYVEVVAAAAGTIIGRVDGNFDKNCAFCTSACTANSVFIRHADGSVAWYLHLKNGSVTTKTIGQTVNAGEYLGVVGSSGNSTGPHLHFEVWLNDTYTTLIDPWVGNCNTTTPDSWWANQQPYRKPTLNDIRFYRNVAPAIASSCPADEKYNYTKTVKPGDTVYMATYYRDWLNTLGASHRILLPNGNVWTSWTQTAGANNYSGAWWYYYLYMPNPAPAGNWKYEVTYNGKTYSKQFFMEVVYTFNGNGNFTDVANWIGSIKPPNPLTLGEVIIKTNGTNQCIVNATQTFSPGTKLTVKEGSNIRLPNNLVIQ
jgi:murein DD-endopeptidase MepM/ murein hydrolase activator NlpD